MSKMSELKTEDYWSKFANGYDDGVDYTVGEAMTSLGVRRALSVRWGASAWPAPGSSLTGFPGKLKGWRCPAHRPGEAEGH